MSCWILTTEQGMSGSLSQALGLADAMGLSATIKTLSYQTPWQHTPLRLTPKSLSILATPLSPPWPEFVICSGKRTIIPALAIKKQAPKTKLIYLQRPQQFHRAFDHIIMPSHDHPIPGAILTLGAIHRASPKAVAQAKSELPADITKLPHPIVAVLIGGNARSHQLDAAATKHLITSLNAFAASHKVSLVLLPSRRTPADAIESLKADITAAHSYLWQPPTPSPYLGCLAIADAFIVTEESVSMVSEAAVTGKPIYLFPLTRSRHSKRINHFLQEMNQRGITRWFNGKLDHWDYEPLYETDRVAKLLVNQEGGGGA